MDIKQAEHDIVYPSAIPFIIFHLLCLGIVFTGISWASILLCVILYLVRMFAVTGGYHRYFSHRAYKTSRWFQFVMAFVCQTSAQRGAIWWAAKHREHHKYSDTPLDVHSPRQYGFLFSHVGWIFSRAKEKADYTRVKDLMKYPELVWLNKNQYLPAILLGFLVFLLGGAQALFVGFFLSTVFLYHGTFAINSLAHVVGKQVYDTGDDSRNNFWLALITLGEGWHNNHHYFPGAARQGIKWWEIDMTYYALKLLSMTGLIWNLRRVQ